MNLFRRSRAGIFASESLVGHLIRGAVAAILLAWAIRHQMWMLPSLLAAAGALVALRGCPICWIVGLVETVTQKRGRPPETSD